MNYYRANTIYSYNRQKYEKYRSIKREFIQQYIHVYMVVKSNSDSICRVKKAMDINTLYQEKKK